MHAWTPTQLLDKHTHIAVADAEGSRASRLREFEKEVDDASEVESVDQDGIEEVLALPLSSATSRAGSRSNASVASHGEPKKIIRFKDGDPDNPDNWRQVQMFVYIGLQTLTSARSRSCTRCL